jgi:predicted RNase H-like HicB family nuclease
MDKFTAVYERVDGWWVGYVEEIPGANTQGRTLEEARENLKEAVHMAPSACHLSCDAGSGA